MGRRGGDTGCELGTFLSIRRHRVVHLIDGVRAPPSTRRPGNVATRVQAATRHAQGVRTCGNRTGMRIRHHRVRWAPPHSSVVCLPPPPQPALRVAVGRAWSMRDGIPTLTFPIRHAPSIAREWDVRGEGGSPMGAEPRSGACVQRGRALRMNPHRPQHSTVCAHRRHPSALFANPNCPVASQELSGGGA